MVSMERLPQVFYQVVCDTDICVFCSHVLTDQDGEIVCVECKDCPYFEQKYGQMPFSNGQNVG